MKGKLDWLGFALARLLMENPSCSGGLLLVEESMAKMRLVKVQVVKRGGDASQEQPAVLILLMRRKRVKRKKSRAMQMKLLWRKRR